ncbi:hypothetical protein OROGR_030587 [Orobanche gracilis]
MDGFTVNVPELKLLKQYQNDVSWISRFNNAQLELFLEEMDGFTVNVPELKLLKQYQNDVSWISRFNNAMENSQQYYDQENIFNELTCIMNDGALLKFKLTS